MLGERAIIDEVDPAQAYQILESDPDAVLVDVRTRAEWAFVGMPDLAALDRPVWAVEWVSFPSMTRNPGFLDDVANRLGDRPSGRLFFLCRSGARSMAAAQAVAQAGLGAHCTNVAEGFEGDLDEAGHRGRRNGWKVRGLPWRQS
jgi:rhodanese-related sulfurtransferase